MKREKGFTLVEIVIVIAILVVIAGIFSVNMVRTLNKNKIEENKNVVSQIKSAADTYISANPLKIENLYTGYGYVDIPISELRDDGLLSEDLKDAETGIRIPDETIVRIVLDKSGNVEVKYPVDKNELNIKSWSLVAEDLNVSYNANTNSNSWCTNQAKTGWGTTLYLINNDEYGKKYTGNNSILTVKSCNVNPQMAGSYKITYEFKDPTNGTVKTKDRNVYVQASSTDIASFTFMINNNKEIGLKATNVPITINEIYKNGDKKTFTISDSQLSTRGYKLENFQTQKAVTNETATLSKIAANSDGSQTKSAKDEYTVTDSVSSILIEKAKEKDPNYQEDPKNPDKLPEGLKNTPDGIYFTGENPDNVAEINGMKFYIYNINGNVIKLIYADNFGDSPYGQLGECDPSCCNNGRILYVSLGDTSNVRNYFNETMDDKLDSFKRQLNKQKYVSLTNQNIIYYNFKTEITYRNQSGNNKIVPNQNMNSSGAIQRNQTPTSVSLMSLNEYKNIANCNGTSCQRNYLSNMKFWLLDFESAKIGAGNYTYGALAAYIYHYGVDSNGNIIVAGSHKENYGDITTDKLAVRPTIAIKNAKFTSGDGTVGSPYKLQV